MVEAAGIEPDYPQSTNRLMAHDFRRKALVPGRFSPSIESPPVPWSRPQSWRYLETALEHQSLKSKGNVRVSGSAGVSMLASIRDGPHRGEPRPCFGQERPVGGEPTRARESGADPWDRARQREASFRLSPNLSRLGFHEKAHRVNPVLVLFCPTAVAGAFCPTAVAGARRCRFVLPQAPAGHAVSCRRTKPGGRGHPRPYREGLRAEQLSRAALPGRSFGRGGRRRPPGSRARGTPLATGKTPREGRSARRGGGPGLAAGTARS